jgi:uncharacterized protein
LERGQGQHGNAGHGTPRRLNEWNRDLPPEPTSGFYPGQSPIDAYGDGGFRFAGMSHRGSLLVLPSGVHAWEPGPFEALTSDSFALVLAERDRLDFLLLGTGQTQRFPAPALRIAFEAAGLGLEAMSTGAAARTFNVLLAEGRRVAAALIAVA